MKNRKGTAQNLLQPVIALAAIGLLVACNETSPLSVESDGSDLLTAGAATHADVIIAGGGPVVEGAKATLVRRTDTVSGTIRTLGLEPGDAVTLWFAVFQNPEECEGPCDGPDFGNPAVNGGVFFADGKVVGASGRAAFSGKISLGDAAANTGNILTEIEGTEFHFVVRSHGEAFSDRELLREQLSGLSTGCNPACSNVQAAVFSP